MDHEQAVSAVVLASQAQFAGLVDLLIQKGVIGDGESPQIIEKAIAFLAKPDVVRATPAEVQTAARKILSKSLGAMQRTAIG